MSRSTLAILAYLFFYRPLGWCAVRIDGVDNTLRASLGVPAPKHSTGRLRSARLGFVRRHDRRGVDRVTKASRKVAQVLGVSRACVYQAHAGASRRPGGEAAATTFDRAAPLDGRKRVPPPGARGA